MALLALLGLHLHQCVAQEGTDAYGDEEGFDDDYPMDGEGMGGEDMPAPGAASEELADVAALDAFLDNDDASVIGAFKSTEDGAFAEYQQIASTLQYDWRFAHSTDPAVLERVKAKNGGLILFRTPRCVALPVAPGASFGSRCTPRLSCTPRWLSCEGVAETPLDGQSSRGSRGEASFRSLFGPVLPERFRPSPAHAADPLPVRTCPVFSPFRVRPGSVLSLSAV